jgi:hypothetical protein
MVGERVSSILMKEIKTSMTLDYLNNYSTNQKILLPFKTRE